MHSRGQIKGVRLMVQSLDTYPIPTLYLPYTYPIPTLLKEKKRKEKRREEKN